MQMREKENVCSVFNTDTSETVDYNNPLFPAYVRYGILSAYPDYSGVSHWHEDLEFILIKKGEITWNVNGELIELSENNGIMVNSRQLHYGFSPQRRECEFICIVLSPELLRGNKWFYQKYIEYITGNSACPYLYLDQNSWQGLILSRLEKIYDSFGTASKESLPCFDLLGDFLFIMKILYENLAPGNQAGTKESAELVDLRNMLTYIEEHFSRRLTLEEIALAGACCKSRCCVLFKKYLRETPVIHITKLRLRKSLAALLDSDRGITDIAGEYGFCSASYYCEIFRKYYGVSPLQYRKENGLS